MKKYKNHTITVAPFLSEVEVTYKTKVKASDRVKVTTPKDASDYARQAWGEGSIEYREEMMLILLNTNKQILGWAKIGVGGLSTVVCDPKVIFSIALAANASSIILVHNHPSGSENPSHQDMQLTRTVEAGGNFLDIKLLDHLILTADTYYSFGDNGFIK